MRTVKLRSWVADFLPVAEGLESVYRNYLYYSRRRAFNPAMVYLGSFLASVGLAFIDRVGVVAAISQAILGAYFYLTTRKVASNLRFRRVSPEKAIEGELIEIVYEIENASPFAASDLLLTDRFSGSLEPEETVWLDEPIKPFRTYRGSYTRKFDAGMGVFSYGPFTAVLSDPLGIFQFVITENEQKSTQVYPRVTQLPNLPIHGFKESFTYGIYDVASRGLSSNFVGVRDYERGDSLRYIAWKLTLKARKLLVKEFEKSVNASITLVLDMTAANHMGWKAASTWEYAKDIALSIVSRELANGNLIQLVSNNRLIPAGSGEQHNLMLIKSVFDLVPEPDHSETNLVERAAGVIGAGTTAVYIGPVFGPAFERVESSLIELLHRGVDVIAVLLDAGSFVEGKIHGQMKLAVDGQIAKSREILDESASRLVAAGVLTYAIRNGCDIGVEMLRPLSGAGSRSTAQTEGGAP